MSLVAPNAPGLARIQYRLGTFDTLRAAMLADVARADLFADLTDAFGPLPPNPFASWKPGISGDYQTAFIELWAYLADVLTCYQETIANEAYIGTATLRDSLVRLARLVDYEASPGAAAQTMLAFTLNAGKSAVIPARTRTATKPAGGAPPVLFEIATDLPAEASWNAIPLSPVAVMAQFAPLSSFATVFVRQPDVVYPDVATFALAYNDIFSDSSYGAVYFASIRSSLAVHYFEELGALARETLGTRNIVLEGASLHLAPGDIVLTVEHEGSAAENVRAFRLTDVAANRANGTTTISWDEGKGVTYSDSPNDPVSLYILRVKAGMFGNTAPAWSTLNSTLQGSGNWDDPSNAMSRLPFDPAALGGTPNADNIYLDARYPGIKASEVAPDRGYLFDAGDPSRAQTLQLVDAEDVAVIGFMQSAKITRVSLVPSTFDTSQTFPIRTTVLCAGAQQLVRHDTLPLPDPLAGSSLVLTGTLPDLIDGKTVIVQGVSYDVLAGGATGEVVTEVATLSGAPVVDAEHGLTVVTLSRPLVNRYVRAQTSLLANVAVATNGQTVSNESLGTGDGSALQRFTLQKSPLTYLPASGAGDSVSSTLSVAVNGVLWSETQNLFDCGPTDHVYAIDRSVDGSAAVQFGDGAHGIRPPSGAVLRATYRYGLGTAGNAAANAISSLMDHPPGVLRAVNPLAASGGVDPDSPDAIRSNAPLRVRTFDRAVGLGDIASLANTYPGIAKAIANWRTTDDLGISLAHPYIELIVATSGLIPLAAHAPPLGPALRAFLDARRDPNVALRILDAEPLPIIVTATLDVDASYGRNAVLSAAGAALGSESADGGFFDLSRRTFGEAIALSTIYTLLQAVDGVRDARIAGFAPSFTQPPIVTLNEAWLLFGRFLRRPSTPVLDTIFLSPRQIATLDPRSRLTIGSGGFTDR